MPPRVPTRFSVAMSGTTRNVVSLDPPTPERRTRIFVSLDPPPPPSSSSDSASWESILAADVALCEHPGVSLANVSAGQLLLRRTLDRMSAHMNSMQLQIGRLNVEVAHLKRRRF